MPEKNPLSRARTVQALVDQFLRMGISQEPAKEMATAAAAASRGGIMETCVAISLANDDRERAIDGALKLAYATLNGRLTLADLQENSDVSLHRTLRNTLPGKACRRSEA